MSPDPAHASVLDAGFAVFLLLTLWVAYAEKPRPFQLGLGALSRWEQQVRLIAKPVSLSHKHCHSTMCRSMLPKRCYAPSGL